MTTKDKLSTQELMALQWEVEQFLYHEANLLDQRRFPEWLDLITDDIRYWMPMSRNVKFGEQDERELTRELQDVSWIDEGKVTLDQRVRQIMTGIHWAEEPLSRIVHMVSNVVITDVSGDEVSLSCRFFAYRNRVETETDFFVGRRNDTLRKVDGEWKICRREVILAQSVLLAKNLTLFF